MHFFLQRCNCYFSFFFWSLIIKSWNALLQYVIFCLNYCQLSLYHLLIHTFFLTYLGFDPCETGWASLQLDACVTNILIGKLTPHIGQSSKGAFLQTNKILHAIFFLSDCQINCIFNFWKPEEDYFFLFLFWLLLFYVASTIYMTH